MKKFTVLLLLVCITMLSGCMSTKPFQPPAICENSESIILSKINDPLALSKGLLTLQIAALETIDGYTADDAVVVLDQIDAAVDNLPTYTDLVVFVLKKIEVANSLAGAAIFLAGDDLNMLSSPLAINECDKALIRAHLSRQRLLLKLYQAR